MFIKENIKGSFTSRRKRTEGQEIGQKVIGR
jgi:hypothetical protein